MASVKLEWMDTNHKAAHMGITPERVRNLIPKWDKKWVKEVYKPSKRFVGRVSKKYTWLIRADAPEPRKPHGRPRKDA